MNGIETFPLDKNLKNTEKSENTWLEKSLKNTWLHFFEEQKY